MKKYIFTTMVFLFYLASYSQAIRKDLIEMTSSERLELQNAFYAMRDLDNDGASDANPDDDDLMNDLGDFHLNYFNFDGTADPTQLDIHLNLAIQSANSEPEREIFFSWHRAMLFELEQQMQEYNPNIGMPYWNSVQVDNYDNTTVTDTINSTIFTSDFLGPFNTDWSLNRNVGRTGKLPTVSDIVLAFSKTEFFKFSVNIERKKAHAGAHVWIGGVMPTSASARDPVFYLHHAFVDKLWDEWENDPANDPSAYHPGLNNMLRYDGTYTFHGNTLPSIDPDDIVDSKVYGTFYAENQLALLEDYTISNTYNTIENFYYQYVIEAGNNFIVPSTKNCKFESVNEVLLSPGFVAELGSIFVAKIDADNDISTAGRGRGESKKGVHNPYDYNPNVQDIVFDENTPTDEVTIIHTFPNPFKDKITMNFNKRVRNCKVEIFDMMSKVIREEIHRNVSRVVLSNLKELANGTYLLKVTDMTADEPLIIRRFIKL